MIVYRNFPKCWDSKNYCNHSKILTKVLPKPPKDADENVNSEDPVQIASLGAV